MQDFNLKKENNVPHLSDPGLHWSSQAYLITLHTHKCLTYVKVSVPYVTSQRAGQHSFWTTKQTKAAGKGELHWQGGDTDCCWKKKLCVKRDLQGLKVKVKTSDNELYLDIYPWHLFGHGGKMYTRLSVHDSRGIGCIETLYWPAAERLKRTKTQ